MREAPIFIKEYFSKKEIIKGAEIGVFECFNAADMLENIPNLHLILVDNLSNPHPQAQSLIIVANLRSPAFNNRYRTIWKSSLEASLEMKDKSFDFVYLDAGHKYMDIHEDINLWLPKIKEGGILCGHDYECQEDNFAVKRAVDEFIGNNYYRNLRLHLGKEIKKDRGGVGQDWWILI